MTSQIIIEKKNKECEKDHYVLYFAYDNTFDVIKKDRCDDLNLVKNTVQVFYPRTNKYFEGEIIYEGTKEKCEKKCKKYLRRQSTQVSSTEDDGIQKNQWFEQSRPKKFTSTAKDSQSLYAREFEKIRTITNNMRTRSPTPQREFEKIKTISNNKRARSTSPQRDNDDFSFDDGVSRTEYKKLKIDIENLRTDLNANLDKHFNAIKEMISSLPNKQADDQYPDELWYNDINLLDYGATNIQKYVSKLMDELYTEQEMGESYVIDGASTSKKKPLDLERLRKIRDAVFIKYRVPNGKKNEYWELVKDRACRKCLDVSKKFRKN